MRINLNKSFRIPKYSNSLIGAKIFNVSIIAHCSKL